MQACTHSKWSAGQGAHLSSLSALSPGSYPAFSISVSDRGGEARSVRPGLCRENPVGA